MRKLPLLSLLIFIMPCVFAIPEGGISFWNYSSTTDVWGGYTGSATGVTSVNLYPTFNISGDGGPTSYSYDGTGDYVTMGDQNIFDFGTGNFTFSVWVKPDISSGGTGIIMGKGGYSTNNGYLFFFNSNDLLLKTYGTSDQTVTYSFAEVAGTWYHYVAMRNGTTMSIWKNGVNVASGTFTVQNVNNSNDFMTGTTAGAGASYSLEGDLDYIMVFNRALSAAEIGSLYAYGVPYLPGEFSIYSINCTSCNPPSGDTTSPYTTADTTPTFSFLTNSSTNCRIADENMSYNAMNSSRQCTTGEASMEHICTLTIQDELSYPSDNVYVHCVNSLNSSLEADATLLMNITYLEVNGSAMIQEGIENSVIWPDATVYSDQKVYLRNLNNDQLLTTVDKVVVSGNQRWLFNYAENNQSIGLFNLTPVVYVLDLVNTPLLSIPDIISEFIASTKS